MNDENLRYTIDNKLSPEIIKELMGKNWSNLLDISMEGEFYLVSPKKIDGKSIDGRNKIDRFLELVFVACILQRISDLKMTSRKDTMIDVSKDLYQYVPRVDYILNSRVWIAPKSIVEELKIFLADTSPELIPFPKSDLPYDVDAYPIKNDYIQGILKSYILKIDNNHKFIILQQFAANVSNGDINILKSIATEINMQDLLNIDMANDQLIQIKAWMEVTRDNVKTLIPSYENLLVYFLHVKKYYMEKISFGVLVSSSLDIKIIKNQLWTTPRILKALLSTNLLSAANVKENNPSQIGNYPLYKYSLNQSGIEELKKIFGESIMKSEFIIRPLKKVEIHSLDQKLLEYISETIEEHPNKFKLINRSLTNIIFESIETNNTYLNVMRLYFMVKYTYDISLVSELNPQNTLIGIEALNAISKLTDFGRENSYLHIMQVEKDGQIKLFLVGNKEAVAALLAPFPENIKNDIQLDEIKSGILGRRISSKLYTHIYFMLD